jgi:hypothetical protein
MTLGFTVWVSGAVRSGMVIHKKVSSQSSKWVMHSLTEPRFPLSSSTLSSLPPYAGSTSLPRVASSRGMTRLHVSSPEQRS